ncbi:MAG: Ig-like domain-containing protein [Bacilli bacterium]|nr:Ig-like domain-containing protein [Bacilli bacterium]
MEKKLKVIVVSIIGVGLILLGYSLNGEKKPEVLANVGTKGDIVETIESTKKTFSIQNRKIVLTPEESKIIGVNYVDAEDLHWYSEDENIATVDEVGNIFGKNTGTTNIVAEKAADDYVKCEIEVIKEEKTTKSKTSSKEIEVTGLILNETNVTMREDETKQLEISIYPEEATDKTIVWSSSNNDIVSVKDGLLTAHSIGEAKITATNKKSGKSVISKVKVLESNIPKKINISSSEITLGTGSSDPVSLSATIEPETAENKTVTWTSDNNDVATVDSNGTVKGIHSGTTVIRATTVNGLTAESRVTVTSTERLHFIPVKDNMYDTSAHGDAILLESDGYYAMIDTGHPSTFESGKSNNILKYLAKRGIYEGGYPLDFILLTHMHGDHYGGVIPIMQSKITVKKFYMKRYSSTLGKLYEGDYKKVLFCARDGASGCKPAESFEFTQTIDNPACPNGSNTANSNFNCTAQLYFHNMSIKLYNTGYVQRYTEEGSKLVPDIGPNGKHYKCLKKDSTGKYQRHNTNYESIYQYIQVNNHKIVLAADALGTLTETPVKEGEFESDRWYSQILKDSGPNIDILKAPHHGDPNGDKNYYTKFNPKSVVITNNTTRFEPKKLNEKLQANKARKYFVEYYENNQDVKTLYADVTNPEIKFARLPIHN